MDLTTEIKGTPDVYNEFANHLKGFNFDPAPYLPDLGLPSMEDVRDMRNKAVQQLKDQGGTLVLQYCYALDVEGQLAANGILHTHPEGTKLLLQSLSEAGDMFKPTPEDEEVEKRKLVLNDTKTRTVFGAQGTNTTLRSLRGVQKYAGCQTGGGGNDVVRKQKYIRSRGIATSRCELTLAMEVSTEEVNGLQLPYHGEGSVASIGTGRRTRLSYVSCVSEAEDKAEFLDISDLEEFPEDAEWRATS
eukprot:symbB.v1.2.028058.t2/scaffold2931.1/size66972/2